ncbi:MAG: hypothetical protein ABMB14_27000 [Myxococcota bacterium]
MRKFAPVFLVGLPGCMFFTPQWEGVWFVDAPSLDVSACDPVVSNENFDDAEVPDAATGGDWTIVDNLTLSDEAYFLQVLNGKGNQVFVVIGDEVFPGTQTKDQLTVTWTRSTVGDYSETHVDGYDFAVVTDTTVDQTITLTKTENGLAKGTTDYTSTSTLAYTESDRWKSAQTGVGYSQMPSISYLTGVGAVNLPDNRECADDDCVLTVTTACDGASDFTATFSGEYDNGMWAGIEDASQPAGAPVQ